MKRDEIANLKISIYGVIGSMAEMSLISDVDMDNMIAEIDRIEVLIEKQLPNVTKGQKEKVESILPVMHKRIDYANELRYDSSTDVEMLKRHIVETYKKVYRAVTIER